ncbi:hypothetical protein [Homoserinibacter sp. YIM 151385]|uniref:hypothetical protein n=1 Tax=Homoserinibacter sp. YIM 151385 TaxID=2985506 RepID=UPI0022F002C1|nr:hypothetical protein [Homoserinibacter sp. YIM 151385]WBU38675.1 hypothetical protein OF852_03560 [Homoserinibacter sp. YIM 151385]
MRFTPAQLLDGIPEAERSAMRLDGEIARLALGDVPLDAIDSPALRAGVALPRRDARLVAELGTAAWIWGARDAPPEPPELCVELRSRVVRPLDGAIRLRERTLPAAQVRELDGVRVTGRALTAIDLARDRAVLADVDRRAIALLLADAAGGAEGVLEILDSLPSPHRRRAASRLREIAAQEALTR